MAQKRPKERDFSHVKTFNLFSAFGEDGKIKSACKPAFQDMISDEEEDVEEMKAKLEKTSSKGGKGKGKKKRRKKYCSDSDDGEDVEVKAHSSRTRESSCEVHDSPSPPPSPEFDEQMVAEIMDKNRAAAQVIQNLERTMRSYQMAKAHSEVMDFISPLKTSPTKVFEVQEDSVSRATITVKVRTRDGLLRFEDYQMNATFDELFKELGSRDGVDSSRIRVTRKGDDIMETDTPQSIKLHIADILEYVVVDGGAPAILNYSLLDEEDFVIIRLRTSERHSDTTRRIAKMEPLSKVFEEFAVAQSKPLEKCRFLFDGDNLSGQETPEDLDMDEENVIDVEILP